MKISKEWANVEIDSYGDTKEKKQTSLRKKIHDHKESAGHKAADEILSEDLGLMADALQEFSELSEALQHCNADLCYANRKLLITVGLFEERKTVPGCYSKMAQEAVNNLSFFGVPLHTEEGRTNNQPLNPKIFYEALKTSIATRLLDDKDVELAETLKVMDTKTWPTKVPVNFGENEMRKLASRFKLNERQLITGLREHLYSRALPGSLNPLKQSINSIAISSSECERGFSQMNLIITPLRSSLNITVSGLLFLKINGPPLRLFDPEKYVNSRLVSGHHSALAVKRLQYNQSADCIDGFEDLGNGQRRPVFAEHALVFMARGIFRKWKQPISFYFTKSGMKSIELVLLIKDAVRSLLAVGFKVVATVCDQLATNTAAYKWLLEETNRKCLQENVENRYLGFLVENVEVLPLYDTPHLLKGIRNNLLEHDASFLEGDIKKVASWKDIVAFYEFDTGNMDIKMCNKLTNAHIYKSDIKKMKVKNATQVFSRTVSAIMRGFALRGVSGVPVSAGDTADFLLFFDKLFDSLNASTINVVEGKELRGAVTNTSPHVEFWQYAVRYLENIKFFNRKASQPPSVKNFIFTIKRIMYLRTTLSTTTNAKFLCTRHINQDPLENFFGCIRNHGARNINPTCHSFLLSLKTLLINNFLSPHSPGANCEEDDTEGGLAELSNLLSGEPPSPVMEPTHTVNIPSTQVQVDAATYSQTYVAGYIAQMVRMQRIKKSGSKAELVERIVNCIVAGREQAIFLGVDGGKWYDAKRNLNQINGSSSSFYNFVKTWHKFGSQIIPKYFNKGHIYTYIAGLQLQNEEFELQDSNAGTTEKPFRKGSQFVQSDYIFNVYDAKDNKSYYLKAQCYSSFKKNVSYGVEITLNELSGAVVGGTCECRQSALGRCSHVTALLLFLDKFTQENGHDGIACTSRLREWGLGAKRKTPGAVASKY
ncbi:e3 sumo-protein ligase [Holotrichia oblita]|uniref:E3 sumo-protein ligase n=1 Tax=Holotrichia oblita TaxID=644536 RepID=A0ACB9TMQ9_HOLOL|nr:e3 sumo-protein ligase [Holotrichia oblita]